MVYFDSIAMVGTAVHFLLEHEVTVMRTFSVSVTVSVSTPEVSLLLPDVTVLPPEVSVLPPDIALILSDAAALLSIPVADDVTLEDAIDSPTNT